MSDVTQILSQIDAGDQAAAEQLLPLVYEELRKLAASKLAQEQPGQTLQATALVDNARRKQSLRQGGQFHRQDVDLDQLSQPENSPDLLAIDEALVKLAQENPPAAKLVELRFFIGFGLEEAALALGISVRTANRYWTYAKAFLHNAIHDAG